MADAAGRHRRTASLASWRDVVRVNQMPLRPIKKGSTLPRTPPHRPLVRATTDRALFTSPGDPRRASSPFVFGRAQTPLPATRRNGPSHHGSRSAGDLNHGARRQSRTPMPSDLFRRGATGPPPKARHHRTLPRARERGPRENGTKGRRRSLTLTVVGPPGEPAAAVSPAPVQPRTRQRRTRSTAHNAYAAERQAAQAAAAAARRPSPKSHSADRQTLQSSAYSADPMETPTTHKAMMAAHRSRHRRHTVGGSDLRDAITQQRTKDVGMHMTSGGSAPSLLEYMVPEGSLRDDGDGTSGVAPPGGGSDDINGNDNTSAHSDAPSSDDAYSRALVRESRALLVSSNRALLAQNQSLHEQRSTVEKQRQELRHRIGELEARNRQLEARNRDLEAQVITLRERAAGADDARRSAADLRSQLTTVQARARGAEAKCNALTESLQAAKQATDAALSAAAATQDAYRHHSVMRRSTLQRQHRDRHIGSDSSDGGGHMVYNPNNHPPHTHTRANPAQHTHRTRPSKARDTTSARSATSRGKGRRDRGEGRARRRRARTKHMTSASVRSDRTWSPELSVSSFLHSPSARPRKSSSSSNGSGNGSDDRPGIHTHMVKSLDGFGAAPTTPHTKPAPQQQPEHPTHTHSTDAKKRFAMFEQAAKFGVPRAMVALARCYARGMGVSRDPKLAFSILSSASLAGNADAAYYRARCYEGGIGVPRDLKMALAEYKYAADHGNARSGEAYTALRKASRAPHQSTQRPSSETGKASTVVTARAELGTPPSGGSGVASADHPFELLPSFTTPEPGPTNPPTVPFEPDPLSLREILGQNHPSGPPLRRRAHTTTSRIPIYRGSVSAAARPDAAATQDRNPNTAGPAKPPRHSAESKVERPRTAEVTAPERVRHGQPRPASVRALEKKSRRRSVPAALSRQQSFRTPTLRSPTHAGDAGSAMSSPAGGLRSPSFNHPVWSREPAVDLANFDVTFESLDHMESTLDPALLSE